jgi:hypothetical protein
LAFAQFRKELLHPSPAAPKQIVPGAVRGAKIKKFRTGCRFGRTTTQLPEKSGVNGGFPPD